MEAIEAEVIDYYKVGSRQKVVYSNSFGSWLNPEEGGSPQKALQFFDENIEEKENKSLEKGKIVHTYIQYPQEFAVAEIPKPTKMLADFADNLFMATELIKQYEPSQLGHIHSISNTITSDKKSANGQSAHILETQAAFEKLGRLLGLEESILIKLFRYARGTGDNKIYKTYDEATLVNSFINEGLKYYNQKLTLQNKIELTASDKASIEGAIASLRFNGTTCALLNLSNDIFYEGVFEFKELDIYFTVNGVPCKARIDRLEINHKMKTIKVIDGKTTSKSVYLFPSTCEYYKYYRQIGFYKKAAIEWVKQNWDKAQFQVLDLANYTVECYFVPVEMQGNYISVVYRVDDEYVKQGWIESKSLIDRTKFHIDNDMWTTSMEEYQNNGILLLKKPV